MKDTLIQKDRLNKGKTPKQQHTVFYVNSALGSIHNNLGDSVEKMVSFLATTTLPVHSTGTIFTILLGFSGFKKKQLK